MDADANRLLAALDVLVVASRIGDFLPTGRMASIPVDVRAQWREADFRRARITEEMLADGPEVIRMDWRTIRIPHEVGVPTLAGTDAACLRADVLLIEPGRRAGLPSRCGRPRVTLAL